jgi:hypothetical protein
MESDSYSYEELITCQNVNEHVEQGLLVLQHEW